MLIILLIALLSIHFPLILYYLCLSVCCGGVEVSQHTCGGQRMTWRRVTHFFYLSVPAIEVRWQASRPTEPSLSIPPLNSLSMRPFCFRCIYSSSFGTVTCVGWCLCHFESYRLLLSRLITLPAIIDSFCCGLLATVSFMVLIDYVSRGLHILIL